MPERLIAKRRRSPISGLVLGLRSGEARRRYWNNLAIEPLRSRLSDAQCDDLVAGLNLVWGAEAVVALYDISGLDPQAAKEVQLRTGLRILRGAIAEADTS